MPRKQRKNISTPFLHVMTQGINKSYIFDNEQDIKYYISLMYKDKEKYNIKIIAYCIMGNHAHLLLEIDNNESLSKYMQILNTKYAIYHNKKYDRVGYVFRDRYKSQEIYNEIELNRCAQYIYNNPIKAKICENIEDYPYTNYKFSKFKTNNIIKNDNEKFHFMDIEDRDISEIITLYLKQRNLKRENLLSKKEVLKELVMYLKNVENISYRKMEKELGISRETLRKLIK